VPDRVEAVAELLGGAAAGEPLIVDLVVAAQRLLDAQGRGWIGSSSSGSPTTIARRLRHSTPTALWGVACPASSIGSQPSAPAQSRPNSRP
jgi:hypothetical protein